MRVYKKPGLDLLNNKIEIHQNDTDEIKFKIRLFFEKKGLFIDDMKVSIGAQYILISFKLDEGVSVDEILKYEKDLHLELGFMELKIVYPVNGKSEVGISIRDNMERILWLNDIGEYLTDLYAEDGLKYIVGQYIDGSVVTDKISTNMPHLLVAGSTNSGKSVFVDNIIMSFLFNHSPDELKMVMLDTKGVEFGIYDGIPHLLCPVIKDIQFSFNVFEYLHNEMRERLDLMALKNVRSIDGYNHILKNEKKEIMPRIVIFVDDIERLIAVAPKSTKEYIIKLTLLARACGIYFVVVTQNPVKEVLTNDIKSNLIGKAAFSVPSVTESKNIIGFGGAEKLVGNGSMLYMSPGYFNAKKLQVPFVSKEEIDRVVAFVKENNPIDPDKFVPSDTLANFKTGTLY